MKLALDFPILVVALVVESREDEQLILEDLNVFAINNPFVLKENMKGLRMYDSCENNNGLLLLVRSSKGPPS